jgi:hypothetical protein
MVRELCSPDWSEPMVQEWLLLLLRFAITRQPSDRSTVRVMAMQLDSLGRQGPPSAFRFFRSTSEEICRAILAYGDDQGERVLRRHLARIDDPRLRRTFQAAVGLPTIPKQVQRSVTSRERRGWDLWKGLASR